MGIGRTGSRFCGQNIDNIIVRGMGGVRFFCCAGKIPVFLELRVRGRRWPRQNLEGEGLAAKILWSKDLAVGPIRPSAFRLQP